MFSIEYLTVGGYITEHGDIYCAKCGEDKGITHEHSHSIAEMDESFPEGVSCDACGTEIVEAPEPEEEEEEEPLIQGVCKDCGNGTLNNKLNPAFELDYETQPQWYCKACGSTHVDIV